jgi:inorganic pyrophosphatase
MKYDIAFWEYLEKLVRNNEIIIDRPKGTKHPKYSDVIYPVDYGYVKNTKSMDNGGIDVFLGSEPCKKIDAIICTIDLIKNDSEIKILLGCTKDERLVIYNFLNNSDFMKAILVRRNEI